MAQSIDELLAQLQQSAEASTQLQNLSDQAAQAAALRTPTERAVAPGTPGSYLGVISDVIAGSRGRQMERELRPQIEEARTQSGLAKTMAQRYKLEQAEEAKKYERDQAAQKREDVLAQRDVDQYVDPADGKVKTVQIDAQGNAYADGVPIENFSQWRKYEKPTTTGRGGRGGAFKPSASQVKDYQEAWRIRGVLNEMEEVRKLMSPEARSELNQPVVQGFAAMLPSTGQRWAEEQMYSSPEAKSYISRINRVESKLSQLAAGLNVTGFEMKDRQRWSPNAPGITDEERTRRLNNIDRDLFGQIRNYERLYPDYTFEAISGSGAPDAPLALEDEFGTPEQPSTGLSAEEEAEYQALLRKYGGK